jgi:hypothetical protein
MIISAATDLSAVPAWYTLFPILEHPYRKHDANDALGRDRHMSLQRHGPEHLPDDNCPLTSAELAKEDEIEAQLPTTWPHTPTSLVPIDESAPRLPTRPPIEHQPVQCSRIWNFGHLQYYLYMDQHIWKRVDWSSAPKGLRVNEIHEDLRYIMIHPGSSALSHIISGHYGDVLKPRKIHMQFIDSINSWCMEFGGSLWYLVDWNVEMQLTGLKPEHFMGEWLDDRSRG